MRIVVTGATGFVGQHFVDHALTAGHSVAALHRIESPKRARLVRDLQSRGVEFHPGNVRDPASLQTAMRGADCVCHFASAFREAGASNEFFRAVNVAGTRNAVVAAAEHGVRRFVMCGTAGIYGKIVEVREDATIIMEVEDGTKMKISKNAVSNDATPTLNQN
jgi:nucleoside-diphosphate-sugar epimerase